jgi:hypothetical protein
VAQNPDGDTLGFDTQVMMELEFVHAIISKADFRSIFSTALPELLFVTLGYMQITVEQVWAYVFIRCCIKANRPSQEELWASDPNEYVADEDDESRSFSPRISCIQLLQELFDRFADAAIKPFAVVAARHLMVPYCPPQTTPLNSPYTR